MRVKITTQGMNQVIKFMKERPMKVEQAAGDIAYEAANRISRIAKNLVNLAQYHPQHLLSKSITIQQRNSGVGTGIVLDVGPVGVPYAEVVHDGTPDGKIGERYRSGKRTGEVRPTYKFMDKAARTVKEQEMDGIIKKHAKTLVT